MDHCLNASLLCLLILREHSQGAIYTQHKHQTTHERLHAWPSPNFDKSQSNHKAPPETPWVIFICFLRDGPGKGHCLYKQCNTPKQTRLRKALLHYFWQSPRHKGQQGSAIVSSLKTGFASRPIFSKVMLSSDQK